MIAFIKADRLTTLAEDALFVDNIIYAKSSPYQRIVVTKGKTGHSLFLNGNLQFNSFDEYRYHEALVHPAFAAFSGHAKRVLVLGGGDGLALREIEKYKSVEFIQLVDLDPEMTKVSSAVPALGELNKHAFDDQRVHVTNADAFVWLDNTQTEPFDIVDRRFSRSEQLCSWQTLHDTLLQSAQIKTKTRFVSCHSNNFALDRPPIILVHHQDTRIRWLYRKTVSNDCAELWRLGLCSRKNAAF